jgi:hypothetical protein
MSNMGRALMGTGIGNGKRRAIEAAEMAISSPLLEDVSIDGATGILINITGGPDLTLHEVNEASSLIQQAAHEEANIIFGSVIDPNVTDEVRITVIATGFDHARKTVGLTPEIQSAPAPTNRRASTSASQIVLPYDAGSQTTREYPPPSAPRRSAAQTGIDTEAPASPSQAAPRRTATEPGFRAPAQLVADDADIDVSWEGVNEVERALADLKPEAVEPDLSGRLAAGSGPALTDGAPLVQPGQRKQPMSRPNLKTVLGEMDGDSELDVPTFIRRHSTTHG